MYGCHFVAGRQKWDVEFQTAGVRGDPSKYKSRVGLGGRACRVRRGRSRAGTVQPGCGEVACPDLRGDLQRLSPQPARDQADQRCVPKGALYNRSARSSGHGGVSRECRERSGRGPAKASSSAGRRPATRPGGNGDRSGSSNGPGGRRAIRRREWAGGGEKDKPAGTRARRPSESIEFGLASGPAEDGVSVASPQSALPGAGKAGSKLEIEE